MLGVRRRVKSDFGQMKDCQLTWSNYHLCQSQILFFSRTHNGVSEGDVTHQPPKEGELILYRTVNDAMRIEVLYESETFWLDQGRMAELFGVDFRTISEHLRNIYETGELTSEATLRKFRRVRIEGSREVARNIEFYNLDAIISVGYRVNSAEQASLGGYRQDRRGVDRRAV